MTFYDSKEEAMKHPPADGKALFVASLAGKSKFAFASRTSHAEVERWFLKFIGGTVHIESPKPRGSRLNRIRLLPKNEALKALEVARLEIESRTDEPAEAVDPGA